METGMKRFEKLNLAEALLPCGRFRPFPRADDREGWAAVAPQTRDAWIALAERHAGYEWPALRVRRYRAYWTSGDVMGHMEALFERRSVLGVLALAECLEGEGRFLDAVIDGIFAICEETTWVPPLHRLHDKELEQECMPDAADHKVELVTATTSDLLVWIHYLLKEPLDRVSVRIRQRIGREVRARLMEPYMARDDYWWMGFREGTRVNNWNPWCNSGALMAFLVLEEDQEARAAAVRKVMRSLEAFIRMYPSDGCCDEGPSYWGASGGGLFVALELLAEASDGRIDLFGDPLVRDIGAYIAKVHIHDAYYVAFADGDARAELDGNVIYRYGSRVGDEAMVRLGAGLPPAPLPGLHGWFGLYGHVRGLLSEPKRLALGQRQGPSYMRDAWFPVTQVMVARERAGTERGLFVAAKGGHNREAHNHNDVGSFIVFVDGRPLFVDLGTETYKAQTFGPDRFELWYLQSRYHNLPTVRGVLQQEGGEFRAKDVSCRMDETRAELALDLADAYPEGAGILRWTRTISLHRGGAVRVDSAGSGALLIVTDDYELREETDSVVWTLMTPCLPAAAAEEPGTIRLPYMPGRHALLQFDFRNLHADIEPIELTDERLRGNWGERVYRIALRETAAVSAGRRSISVTLSDGLAAALTMLEYRRVLQA